MSICMRYCNQSEDSVEIVNDGFLKIFNTLHTFEPRFEDYESSVMAWIKKIMIRTSIDRYRKNQSGNGFTEIREEYYSVQEAEVNIIDRLSYKEIISLVQQLTPAYRAVFNLHVIDGYTHEEIAEQLNISPGTSKSNLSKAKISIRKMLAEVKIKHHERGAF